jgi:predicted MPP superfamily phosphohydrolase
MKSLLPVIIFLSFGGTVYALAATITAKWMLRRLKVATKPLKPTQLWLDRIIVTLALAGLVCLAYGYFVEPYWPSVTRVQIKTSKLDRGSRPIRVVQISDLHSDPRPRLEERLPDLIALQKPDLILFTGNCINSPGGLPVFRTCLTRIASIAPTFVVRGYMDAALWWRLDLFGGAGARELDGNGIAFNLGSANIWIAGVGFGGEAKFDRALGSIPERAFTVFLYHSPDLVPRISARQVDLYCSGDTDGGQVALPFYGALVTLSKLAKRYESGLYKVDNTSLYINRGIGMEGGAAPRIRFCSRPEITVIDVVPDGI